MALCGWRQIGLRLWHQRPGLPISWTRGFASAWMCCLHALFRLLISSPFNNRNLKSINIISLSPPPWLLNVRTVLPTQRYVSNAVIFNQHGPWLWGGGRYMGVEWAYFVLVLLEFASYHSNAKCAHCHTQIFVEKERL